MSWVFYLVWLGFGLFVALGFLKIRDGSYLGRGTEGSPGHTYSSYGDKRIFFQFGLLLWVPLETTLVAEYCSFAKTASTQDPGIISHDQNF